MTKRKPKSKPTERPMENLLNFLNKASKSRTIIVNTLVVVAGTLGYLNGHDVIAANPQIVAALASTVGVLNVLLRFLTVEPVSEK